MCGIISASSRNDIDYSAIRLGLLNADDRGGHSCGIAVRGEEANVVRQVANAKTFINDKNDSVSVPRNNKSFIGHTRFATHGSKTLNNAHPFMFGNICGVHNGSIDNFKDLKGKYIEKYRNDVEEWFDEGWYGKTWKEFFGVKDKKELDIESDSLLLYYMIWKEGLSNVLPKLKGTLALVFYKKEDNEEYLYFYRWDKPLCYGYKDGALWIGSLKKYLDSLGCKNIKNVTEHAIYKVKDGRIITSKQQPNSNKPEKKKASKRDDFDPELEPEKKKSYGRKHSEYDSRAVGYYQQNKHIEVTEQGKLEEKNEKKSKNESAHSFQFCAPKHAKGDTNKYNNLALYWFGNNNPFIVYVEVEGEDKIYHYDMRQTQQRIDLRQQHACIADQINDDFSELEITLEYRQEIEKAKEE